MKQHRLGFLSFILLAILLPDSPALLARNYYFRHYDKGDGLAHQTVYSAVQDGNGFIWFGTKSGLSRFDGSSFKNYILDTDRPSYLPSNTVNALTVSPDGTLWIGTSEGLCLYDPVKDTFSPFQCEGFTLDGKSIDILNTDKQGCIWVLCSDGVYVIDPASGTQKHFPSAGFSPTYIHVSQSGRIWILGTDGNIHLFDAQRGEVRAYSILSPEERLQRATLYRILECSNGELLVTTSSLGVRRFSPNTGEVTTLFTTDADGLPIYIHTALQSDADEFWFGTESGIHIYKMGQGFTAHLTKSYEDSYSLSDNAIHMLMKDREGGIWVGSFFGGLNYLSKDSTLFEKYLPKGSLGNTAANVIREILPGPDGILYVGTEDGGLCRFDPSTGSFRTLDGLRWQGQPLSKNIQGLMLEKDRYLWIGTFDQGIYILDTSSQKIIRHYSPGDPASGLTSAIVCIRQTSLGDILVGTTNGLFLYHPETDGFSRIQNSGPLIHSILEDHEHILWVGTLGGGIYKLDATTLHDNPNPERVPFETTLITALYEDSLDDLWIGTEGMGMFNYNRHDGSLTRILPKEEFPGIIVYQIVEDAMGSFWITTSDGLLQYDPSQGVTRRFTISNGLPIDQFNYNSSFQSRTGTIYLGTLKGMISFAPENIRTEDSTPKVFFTGFWLFDKEIEAYQPNSTLSRSILYTDRITLNHDQNTLSLSFAAPSFSISQNTWYRYRMEGLEDDWNITYSPARIYYTKLPPGHYTFKVQASSSSRSWNGEITSLDILIKRPFWETPLAYTFYALLGLGFVLYIVLTSRNQLRRRARDQMARLNDEKQKEILEAKISFFTNITHEIRTPLTLIMGSLNRILGSGRKDFVENENIQIMSKNSQRLLDLVNQLLDFRKIESSTFLMDFVRLDAVRIVEDIYTRFTPMAQVKGVDFHLSIPKGRLEVTADKEALTKILSNMLSNALKFCAKSVQIDISEVPKDGARFVRIRVDNDGKRIPDEESEAIFKPFYQYQYEGDVSISKGSGLGLPLARSLAEMQGGSFYLDGQVKDRNSFVLDMPLEQIDFHESQPLAEAAAHEKETAPIREPAMQDKQGKPAILVVDDELDVRKFIAEELSEKYAVLQAGDGQEALGVLESHNVSLIISDLMMPVMDGVTFCKSVKGNIKYSHIPVIVLTAKVSMQAHLDALEAKADAYIEKPFSTEHLLAQVTNLLSNRELIRSTFISSPYAHLSSVASNSTDERFLEKMNDYVMGNLSDPALSVESLADYMSMSLSTLYRKVKSTTSLSPSDFIRLCRLKKSAELLSQGDMRINEVAENLGFANPSYFTTCFMKQFGITPSEFIKMNQR